MTPSLNSPVLLLLTFILLSFSFPISSSSSSSSSISYPFLVDLHLQCPYTVPPSSVIEMDGESLGNLLSYYETNAYTAILFYASWCPFSKIVQPKFDALALMYPQIEHVKVDQSSNLPSLLSRYGVHSIPSVLLANKTTLIHYHGSKDLDYLSEFFQIFTGLKPAMNITEDDQRVSSSENVPQALHLWNQTLLKDEPYLVFSSLFVLLRVFLFLCPNIVSNVIALWATYIPRLNLAIFGESKQLLTHALLLFNVKSAFSNLKLSKSRKFHNGARSARVLASSFASVSLGETSSARV